jgi:hypothetical protein
MNSGVFTYEQLLTWLQSDDNKHYFSITRTLKNLYGYLFISRDKKFKQDSKELILLAAQKQAKISLQSHTVIESLISPSPIVKSAPLNLISKTSKIKSNPNPHSNIQPNPHIYSNPHSNSHPKPNSHPNPYIYSNPNSHSNPYPTQNPDKPYNMPTKDLDLQLSEMSTLESIGELKLVRKAYKDLNVNIRNKWFYIRLICINIYVYIYVYIYV